MNTEQHHVDPHHLDATAHELAPELSRELERAVRDAQRQWRSPAVSAGVVRGGQLVWSCHAGHSRLDPPSHPTDDTLYLMGSVTKTFVALSIMSLRDEGKLALTDPLSTFLPETKHGSLTIRDLLAHASGLQREPVGRIWETLTAPDRQELLRGLEDADAVLDPHTAWHYSNLAYTLLGEILQRVTGQLWEAVVRERVLAPLGMTSTGTQPSPDQSAEGYYIQPYSGTAQAEPLFTLNATASLGGLWSSVADLGRYAAFIADPTPEVIAPATLAEMCRPVIMRDETWTNGHGLGFMLGRIGERVLVGHSGGMPGFVTGLRVDRDSGVGAVVFSNSTAGSSPMALAGSLVTRVLDAEPAAASGWVPELPMPEVDGILGPWWSEGSEFVFEVRDGELWSRMSGSTADDSRYEQIDEQTWRVAEGREQGELLELLRGDGGSVERMYLATYAMTRQPRAFGDLTS